MACPLPARTTAERGRASPDWLGIGACEHGEELPDPQAGGVALHRELDRDGLVAVGEPGALVDEGQGAPVGEARGRVHGRRQGVEAQGLDPEAGRIDDLEHHRPGGRHLAGHGGGLGDQPVDGRHQGLRLLPYPVEGGAAVLKPLQLGPGVVELGLGDGTGGGEFLEPVDPALDDVDLLVELALALAHVRDVDGLDGGRDEGEDVAAFDRGAEAREQARGWR